MLDNAKSSAYFGDRSILVSLITKSNSPGKLMLAENYLSVEPYALALPRGDEGFQLAVDRALLSNFGITRLVALGAEPPLAAVAGRS